MNFNPQKHHRRSIRLKGYDYAQQGAYFVTICTYQRQCWFGEILDGRMYLNQIGNVVTQEWVRSSQIRQEIELDTWVIMPNHIHGIVLITEINNLGAQSLTPLHTPTLSPEPLHRQSRSLSTFIAGFKASVTKQINIIRQAPGIPMWQRNYHESIIRDEESLHTIRQYIINNPQSWTDDPENPQHYPENQQLLIDLPF
jgi:REP element-mobilizing transposase RayT